MTLDLVVMGGVLLLLAGLAMKTIRAGPIRDLVFGLTGSLLLTVAFLAAAWRSEAVRSGGPWRARGRERRSASQAAGRPS
jgi:hypothetical protein